MLKEIGAIELLRYSFIVARWTLNENGEEQAGLSLLSLAVVDPRTTIATILPYSHPKSGGVLTQTVFTVIGGGIDSIVVYIQVSKILGVVLVPINFVSISCIPGHEGIVLVGNYSEVRKAV